MLTLISLFILCVSGVLGIGRLALQAGAIMNHSDHFNLEVSSMHMRYNSLISANRISVAGGEIIMEGEADLDVSGKCCRHYLRLFVL